MLQQSNFFHINLFNITLIWLIKSLDLELVMVSHLWIKDEQIFVRIKVSF